ncbi:MAG: peptidoglycan bridge formation glycyltransferase FemA/FemB family protein [Chloroflexi bacterium]|nr:MAG: peptidoglycan bridge formation glycyltransferase FemA/FemB family protein [Chloroflexota bacterium]
MSTNWDSFVHTHPRAHILQLSAWGKLKSEFGWSTTQVTLQRQTEIIAGAQILFRPLPFGLGTMAYIPMGPYHTTAQIEKPLWEKIDETAKEHQARFLKWEPGIYLPEDQPPDFKALGFIPSPQTIQPPRTILIDIRGDEDTILSRMNQGTRRKIRLGYKKGVRFYPGTQADIAKFTRMMQTTGTRNEFGVHAADYYHRAFELFPDQVALFMAEHDGDDLAGIMVFALGRYAIYLYGASSNIKRNLMATYGVQWEAIKWARERGCIYYDMWGIPDEDEATLEAEFENRSDGLWGVYGFKRGWGGEVVRSLGAWDKVYNPLIYNAYKLALRLRR